MTVATETLTPLQPRLPDADRQPPLENGDHLDRATFRARYAAMPRGVKAELIGGRVYVMASPVFKPHGRPHSSLMGWIMVYRSETPGTDSFDNTSTALGKDSEPQPDSCLLILPECSGQTTDTGAGTIEGAPELVVEIASSSQSYDLHEKREDYERYGVREYIVYATRPQRVYWWARRDGKYEELMPGTDGVIRSEVFPGLWLDTAAVAHDDPKAILDTLRRGLASPEHAAFVAELASRRKSS